MIDPDLRRQLDALMIGLVSPELTRGTNDSDSETADADAQRVSSAQIDGLLRHVSVLTSAFGTDDQRGWDQVDELAARLLISDLAAFASITRALNQLTASRLASALAELRSARADVERAVTDAPSS